MEPLLELEFKDEVQLLLNEGIDKDNATLIVNRFRKRVHRCIAGAMSTLVHDIAPEAPRTSYEWETTRPNSVHPVYRLDQQTQLHNKRLHGQANINSISITYHVLYMLTLSLI